MGSTGTSTNWAGGGVCTVDGQAGDYRDPEASEVES